MKYKFSIIIPHYNSFDKLERLVKTIPNDENIEIIIIDDNSSNGNIVDEKKKYLDRKNIKFLKNTFNKGAGGARNTGIIEAKGEWLIFADADDFFTGNAFDILKKYQNSDAEIIFFNCTSIFEDSLKEADRHIYFRKLIMDYLENSSEENLKELKYRFGVPWAKMISKKLVDMNRIKFSEILILNDQLFSVKTAYYAKKILVSSEIVYCVVRDYGSLTTVLSKEFFDIKIEEMFRINNFFIEKNEKMYRPHFAGFLITSKDYGILCTLKLLRRIFSENGKIFPKNFVKDIFKGFYLKKFRERIRDKKYKK